MAGKRQAANPSPKGARTRKRPSRTLGASSASKGEQIAQDAFQPSEDARALLATVKRAEDDLRKGGGAFALDDVLTLLRISRQAVHNRVKEGSLFVVKGPGGRLLFPTLQFTTDGPLNGLKEVIAAFPSPNRWLLLNFLVHPRADLDPRTPLDLLKDGDIKRVVNAARTMRELTAGAGTHVRQLYGRAFAEFGAAALWNKQQLANPTSRDALAIARALRLEGNLKARRLAEEIEAASHAAH